MLVTQPEVDFLVSLHQTPSASTGAPRGGGNIRQKREYKKPTSIVPAIFGVIILTKRRCREMKMRIRLAKTATKNEISGLVHTDK